jgi:formylglycine-generating enzyme required for sulfatase activity
MQGFISYAHADAAAFDTLRRDLRALEDAFTLPIELWADDDLHAGQHWNDTIQARIAATDLFILLLSPAFLVSDFIRDTEIPAIRARLRSGAKALICPVLLQQCGWKPRFGRLQMVPMQNRRLVPIDKWVPPADGFDEARAQIQHAVGAYFGLTLAETDWFAPLLNPRQDPAGPMLVERDNQFHLDTAGGEADADALQQAMVRQLYQPNHDKAAELLRQVAARDNDLRGTSWEPLVAATADLAAVLDQPLECLADHVPTLWECSVRVASLLLMDKRLREQPEDGTPPLDAPLHRALDDLVGSLAPWVRLFPTARTLDDQRGEFLRAKALFEPARLVIRQAAAESVVTPAVEATIGGSLTTAERGDVQAEKAGFYAIRGVRNTLIRATGYAAGFMAGAAASGYAAPSPLMDAVGKWLSGVEAPVIELVRDLPADLRVAIGRMVKLLGGTAADDALSGAGPVAIPPSPLPAEAAPGAGSDRPSWVSDMGTDQYGNWVSFTVAGQDGAPVTQRMRWIPPGDFLMGSPKDEAGRYDAEGPQTPVHFATGFWLFDTPCTQALWQAVMGSNPSYFQSPDRPVESVSFFDAQGFISRLNQMVPGLALSLPSEARWEYACRAGSAEATYAGDLTILGANNAPVLDPIAWYGGNSGQGFDLPNGYDANNWTDRQYPDTRAGTHPVARKAPNRWGLYDMLGNVWEWCDDVWHDTHDGAAADGAARTVAPGNASGAAGRVIRGGSWDRGARRVRAAYRDGDDPSSRDVNLGFRCARVQEQSGTASEERRAGRSKPSERSETAATTSPERRSALNRFFSFFRRTNSDG